MSHVAKQPQKAANQNNKDISAQPAVGSQVSSSTYHMYMNMNHPESQIAMVDPKLLLSSQYYDF